MSSSKDRLILNLILGLIVFVGVSSAVSPWFYDLYSAIAPWVFGTAAVGGLIWAAILFGPDLALSHEARESWTQNGDKARALAAKHAAHPEVAAALAERLLQEKLARQQMEQQGHLPVPPPTTPPAV